MNTFIRAIEVWRPSEDRSMLEFGGGLFGTATRFAAISRDMCFGRGEGLPGRAWDEGRPVLLKQFEGTNFRRSAAAKAANITCGLALPIVVDDELTAVLVFFCGDTQAHAGAIELWQNDPRMTGDLTLTDGYYGTGGGHLEALSRRAVLAKGSGLPGIAWQRNSSVFIEDLAASADFVRTESALAAGIDRGLALPCATQGDAVCIAVFLSASATPIARRIERWIPDVARDTLQRADGFCEGTGPLAGTPPSITVGHAGGGGSIAAAFVSGAPIIVKSVVGEPEAVGGLAHAAGASSLAAIPVVADGAVIEVIVLYF